MSELNWQKSSYSGQGANCLNVAATADGTVYVRESDDPDAIVTANPVGLRALLLGIKGGEFDHPSHDGSPG